LGYVGEETSVDLRRRRQNNRKERVVMEPKDCQVCLATDIDPDATISVAELAKFLTPLYEISIAHQDVMFKAAAEVEKLRLALASAGEKLSIAEEQARVTVQALTVAVKTSTELAYHLVSVLPCRPTS